MPTYDVAVDPAAENNSHSLMLRLVGPDKRVLDVGCATGYLGAAMLERGCRVSGVEVDPVAAARATEILDEVLVADLETVDLVDHFGPGTFDVVVFGDVLEHLRDPDRLIRQARKLIDVGGYLVISVPNVAHGSLRLGLAQGTWRYTDRGLLDATHIHFFTRATFLELLLGAGFAATDILPTTVDSLETEVHVDVDALPDGFVDWVRAQPDADAYQFVARAVPDDAEHAVASLRTALAASEQALAACQEMFAASQNALAEARRSVTSATAETERSEVERRRTHDELAALRSTRIMRVSAGPRRVYARLRQRSSR